MRVLLVEDDPDLARSLRRGLSEASYAVDIAGTGEEALERDDAHESVICSQLSGKPETDN